MKSGTRFFAALSFALSYWWMTSVSADDPVGIAPPTASHWTATIDWIDLENRKMVANDRSILLASNVRVYSADRKSVSEKSLKKGMKVNIIITRSKDMPHPIAQEVWLTARE